VGSQQKKKKRTQDNRSLTNEIKRTQDQDVNKLALQPTFELGYSPVGVGTISFVNVSTSMAPAQTNSGYPAQIIGLTITPQSGSDTQLNLAWTANTAPDFNHYNVYRGTSTGFLVGPSSEIFEPVTNSYNNTSLTPGTIYYYVVSATNNTALEGAPSLEVSATTNNLIPPPQVTGLAAAVIGSTEIDLTWTASGVSDFNHYDVHRSTTTGFTPAIGNRIAQPTTNSYNNTSLTALTTYYYKVAAVDNANNIGTYSTQASGTTTATPPVTASLLFHLNGDFTDSSTNALVPSFTANGNGFGTPGKFGSNYWKVDTPTHFPSGNIDRIEFNPIPAPLAMDTSTGFSYSLWINPVDISALSLRRVIVEGGIDANNVWSIQIDSAGIVYFFVKKAGTDIKRQVTGATTGSWHHIVAVYDAAANTVKLYRNAVEGASSTATVEYPTTASIWRCGTRGGTVNAYYTGWIDEVQYFKGAVLTTTQITNLMNTNAT
jgi:hypothetical protein